MFQELDVDARTIHMNYVGELKDIVQLDYGHVHTPIILFRCEWIKSMDNWGNDTYVRNDVGFVLSILNMLLVLQEPFIFPSQATLVFFSNDKQWPGWKILLPKEAQSCQSIGDVDDDVFITTTLEVQRLYAPIRLPTPPSIVSLVGAIELLDVENLLTSSRFWPSWPLAN